MATTEPVSTTTHSPMQFAHRRKGYDRRQVDEHLDRLRLERTELRQQLRTATARISQLEGRVARLDASEDELKRAIDLAETTAASVIEEAHRDADVIRRNAERDAELVVNRERARVSAEASELDGLRMAIAAEAAHLEDVRRRDETAVSAAALRLVDVVDGPDGLGPFSESTARLVDFAESLRAHGPEVGVDLTGAEPVIRP